MDRRRFLTAAAIAPLAAAPIAGAALAQTEDDTKQRIIAVIDQLEAYQGWETSSVVAAKAFAAWQMRKALGLDAPDPKNAQMHVDYQRSRFEEYKGTCTCERDQAEGKHYDIHPKERSLT